MEKLCEIMGREKGDENMDTSKTLIETLGIKVTKLEEGLVTATMPVDERTHQPFGVLHGGASVALAETVASVGTYHLVDQDTESCAGLEINANHIKAKKDGIVTAIATILHRGRTTNCGRRRPTNLRFQVYNGSN